MNLTWWIQQALPVIIMVMSWGAGIVLVFYKQWGSALYWIMAGFLNFAVIFGIKAWG